MLKKALSVMLTVIMLLTYRIVVPDTAKAAVGVHETSAQSTNVSWGNALSLPSKRNAYIAGKAYAPSSVTFVAASFTLWDASGTFIASATEDLSYTSNGLFIFYDIYKDSGVLLNPATKYTYKLTTTFDGYTYESPEYTFFTEGENDNHFGIDVSSHQGSINWEAAVGYVDYAIIRCGYGEDNTAYDDRYWEYNASECERLGIPYGVYLYSYAENDAEADSEANHVLRLLKNHHPSLPVYYDLEDNNTVGKQSNTQIESQANIFCNKLNEAGYDVGVYANLNWWSNRLTSNSYERFHKWVAAYGNFNLLSWEMWQYSSSGSVPGINGRVDLNYSRENAQLKPVSDDPTDPTEAHDDDIIRGDVDGDGMITSGDAIQVLYYTLIPAMYTINQPVDFNGDGMITSDDAIYLLYFALLPDMYPL